jgi:hypothetical protein
MNMNKKMIMKMFDRKKTIKINGKKKNMKMKILVNIQTKMSVKKSIEVNTKLNMNTTMNMNTNLRMNSTYYIELGRRNPWLGGSEVRYRCRNHTTQASTYYLDAWRLSVDEFFYAISVLIGHVIIQVQCGVFDQYPTRNKIPSFLSAMTVGKGVWPLG